MNTENKGNRTTDTVVKRLSPTEIYRFFTRDGVDAKIPSLYHSFIYNKLSKDLRNIHPNEVLEMYNFISSDTYREVMSEIYNVPISKLDIHEVAISPSKKIFDLQTVTMHSELKAILNKELEKAGNELNLIPAFSENGVLFWVVKEPETTEKDESHVLGNYSYSQYDLDIPTILKLVNNLTSKIGVYVRTDLLIVTNTDYINIVKYLNKFTHTSYKYHEMNFNIRYYTRKILIDGIYQGASDIYIWGSKYGGKSYIEYQYTILNDTTPAESIEINETDFKEFESEVWNWAGQNPSNRTHNIRDYDIPNLLDEPIDRISYRGRLNIMPDISSSDKYCIRVINVNQGIVPFVDFKLNPTIKDKIANYVLNNDSGAIIVGGSTGSGKSTLLRSILDYLKLIRPSHRIESVEQPIEVETQGYVQVNIDDKNDMTPEDVIRALTRRNAKILNLNEINSNELFKFSVDCVLMSLLVLTTIHTSSVSAIPDRTLGLVGDNKYLYRQFLQGSRMFLHLTMLKECCPNCTEEVSIEEDNRITAEQGKLISFYGYNKSTILMTKRGEHRDKNCPICNGIGFQIKKPVVCVDYLPIDNSVQDMFSETPTHEMSSRIRDYQMANNLTGVHDAIIYLNKGLVTWDQIYKKFSLINELNSHLKRDKLTNEQLERMKGGY